jgi:hypothetical protein
MLQVLHPRRKNAASLWNANMQCSWPFTWSCVWGRQSRQRVVLDIRIGVETDELWDGLSYYLGGPVDELKKNGLEGALWRFSQGLKLWEPYGPWNMSTYSRDPQIAQAMGGLTSPAGSSWSALGG